MTIDQSGANAAAIDGIHADSGANLVIQQSNYLNNSSSGTTARSKAASDP